MDSPDPHPSNQPQSQDLPIRVADNENGDTPQQPVESPEAETQGTDTDRQPEPAKCDRSQQPQVNDTDEGEGKGEAEGGQKQEQEQEQEDNTTTIDWVQPPEKKKKKRSKKPKSKRGKNKPTGFEEYYVDAPITPEQYKEEREVYDSIRPVLHRMEDAILRYQKNRRLESERWEVFLKFLSYGGVDIGPKMFAGVDDRTLKEMDNEQIMIARGQASIAKERENLEIDFNAVVKGYLTSYFPFYFNPESEDMIKLATVTIRNFLSYLMYHDVCPEYNANIDEARKSCDIANKELWQNQQFTVKSPGDFNMATSTLFGGFFYDMYVEDDQWTNSKDNSVRMTNEIARKVVKFALAGAGTDEQAQRFQQLANEDNLRAMRIEDIDGFEVTAVVLPDDEVREFYSLHAPDLHPIGRLMGKAYRDPGKPALDLSPEEQEEWEQGGGPMAEFEFFLEEELLRFCYPGMKVMTSVFELNCGLHFFDEIFTAYSSIYTVLANDLMLGWKKPRAIGVDGEAKEDDDDDDDEENAGDEDGKEGGVSIESCV